jgi:hypothetical protein
MAESGRTTWHLRIPVAPYWWVATALAALCVPAQAIAFVADVVRAITGAPPRELETAEDASGADPA